MDEDFYSRQAVVISQRVDDYRRGLRTLNQLAQDLEALEHVLSTSDASWRSQFRNAWTTIEDINAVALSEGHRSLTSAESSMVNRALSDVVRLAGELVG